MLLSIRIAGEVNLDGSVSEFLSRLRMRRKYSAVLMQNTPENVATLNKLRDVVAFGPIDEATLKELIKARAQMKDTTKKLDVDKTLTQVQKEDHNEWDIKPFFRLHPPRGGIDSRLHFGVSKKAVLGNNKEKINELVRRML